MLNTDPQQVLIYFWKMYARAGADITGLALYCGVSRTTVYRWLGGQPMKYKMLLCVRHWLMERGFWRRSLPKINGH